MKKTISAGGVVLNTKNRVLVVNQHGTSWSLPKGHVDEEENLLEAAKREIWEESGIKQLKLVKELGSYQRHKLDLSGSEDKSELKTIHMFLFRTDQETLAPVDHENPEARWVAKDEVEDLLTHEKDKSFFASVKSEI